MPAPPISLNESQRHALISGFKYIDRLLTEGLAGVTASGDDGALFTPLVADATPVQRKVIGDQISRLRRAMHRALDTLGISVASPTTGALWSLRTHLNFVEVALEEIMPKHLRGYGPLDSEAAAGVSAGLAQIRAVLDELDRYLASGLGGDITTRLARLDQTRDEVRLLRELERVITAHGLVEFRQSLAQLLDRLEKNWWTVAFVGRVSCGKSSLLNFLLATDVLPSGVTPVTAVPIRIIRGASAAARISFATGKPERVAAAELLEFASEEKNPGNARHVTDVLLELPGPRLAGDVCFVDTPGLGSLATAGAAQTLAFLPRCDVGVLMIDAAATPIEEDLAVARALLEGGADVLVVISKADLLGAADREKMRSYVARQFTGALGRDVPVALISVATNHTPLTETWWSEILAPRQARHRELAALTLRRKIGALREAVVAALFRRAGGPVAVGTKANAHAPIGVARAAIEDARRKAYDIPFQKIPPAVEVLDGIAASLADANDGVEFPGALARELGKTAAQLAERFELLMKETRIVTEHALTAAGETETVSPAELLQASSRPLFDPAPVLASGMVSAGWQRWPTLVARRSALRRQLRARFSAALDDALRHYGHALVGWSHHYLDDLAAQFNAQACLVEAALPSTTPVEGGIPAPELTRDLELLREWNSRSAA